MNKDKLFAKFRQISLVVEDKKDYDRKWHRVLNDGVLICQFTNIKDGYKLYKEILESPRFEYLRCTLVVFPKV